MNDEILSCCGTTCDRQYIIREMQQLQGENRFLKRAVLILGALLITSILF